jgi:hypothetical protein
MSFIYGVGKTSFNANHTYLEKKRRLNEIYDTYYNKEFVIKLLSKLYEKEINILKEPQTEPNNIALQTETETEIIKMIVDKDGINYSSAIDKLNEYIYNALNNNVKINNSKISNTQFRNILQQYDITYIDALKKTKVYLSK